MLSNWTIGVDVGAEYINLVCLDIKGSRPQLMAQGTFARESRAEIAKILAQPAINSGELRVSIDEPSLSVHHVDLPEVPAKELDAMLKWTIKKKMLLTHENFQVRYFPVEQPDALEGVKKNSYICFMLEDEVISRRLLDLKNFGITKAKIIEPHINALSLCVLHNYLPQKNEYYCLINIAKTMTNLSVINYAGLLFSQNLSGLSLEAFNLQYSRDEGVDMDEAARLLSVAKNVEIIENKNIQNAYSQFFSKLFIGVQEAMDGFNLNFPKFRISHLILSGNAFEFAGIDTRMQNTFQIPTVFLDPFKLIDTSRMGNDFSKFAKETYGVSVGLAL